MPSENAIQHGGAGDLDSDGGAWMRRQPPSRRAESAKAPPHSNPARMRFGVLRAAIRAGARQQDRHAAGVMPLPPPKRPARPSAYERGHRLPEYRAKALGDSRREHLSFVRSQRYLTNSSRDGQPRQHRLGDGETETFRPVQRQKYIGLGIETRNLCCVHDFFKQRYVAGAYRGMAEFVRAFGVSCHVRAFDNQPCTLDRCRMPS